MPRLTQIAIASMVLVAASATPAAAICFAPSSSSSYDPLEKLSNAIEYTICLIGDQARIINQHADVIDGIKADISLLRMDLDDIDKVGSFDDNSELGILQSLTVSNAQKIYDLDQKLNNIIARLDALER